MAHWNGMEWENRNGYSNSLAEQSKENVRSCTLFLSCSILNTHTHAHMVNMRLSGVGSGVAAQKKKTTKAIKKERKKETRMK